MEAARISVPESTAQCCPLCELPPRECSHYAFTETLYGVRYLVFIDTQEID